MGNSPVTFNDPRGLFIGSGIAKIVGKLPGSDAEGAAIGGAIIDTVVGGVMAVTGLDIPCVGIPINVLLGGYGGYQGLRLGASMGGVGTGGPIIPLVLAAAGGYELGSAVGKVIIMIIDHNGPPNLQPASGLSSCLRSKSAG